MEFEKVNIIIGATDENESLIKDICYNFNRDI